MAKKTEPKDLFPPMACTGCGEPVQQRRPSQTGWHFCSARACANLKQKMYRARRMNEKTSAAVANATTATVQLIQHLIGPDPFKTCSGCGATRVLTGWVHRTLGDAEKPCYAAGTVGRALATGHSFILDAAMPHLAPAAQKLAAWEAEQAAALEPVAEVVVDEALPAPAVADEGIPAPGLPPF